ncbi:mitochondrial import inner membrane translocase subunit Tim8 B-like [Tubulanus polymorphus]|uniref:mitochondrial import inner membrane translocase subunit Tim8 B-like n=1 Tax=Tubulanus polymorphus TaxID=672921 RepID=UPI003DA598D9
MSSFDMPDSTHSIGSEEELQQFIQLEQQKALFQTQIHRLADVCWDKCIDKPSNKLDSRTETCLTNCVERFIDTSMSITNRFQQMISQRSGMQ